LNLAFTPETLLKAQGFDPATIDLVKAHINQAQPRWAAGDGHDRAGVSAPPVAAVPANPPPGGRCEKGPEPWPLICSPDERPKQRSKRDVVVDDVRRAARARGGRMAIRRLLHRRRATEGIIGRLVAAATAVQKG
jgi:hypothetical protein